MNLKRDTLAKQIGFGYSIILGFFILALAYSLFELSNIEKRASKVQNLKAPTARESLTLLNGVNHSETALNDWIIIGKGIGGEKYKQKRIDAWENQINTSLTSLTELSKYWDNESDLKSLASIKKEINRYRKIQEEIELIAHRAENLPATELLFGVAVPLADSMTAEITSMIEVEKKEKGTKQRKLILGVMADIRGSLGFSLAAIRAYLLSADKKFKQEFDENWRINALKFYELESMAKFLTSKQKISLQRFTDSRKAFNKLPEKMFEIRGSESWNIANDRIKTDLIPISNIIKDVLKSLVKDTDFSIKNDYRENYEHIGALRFYLIISLVLGGLTSFYMALNSIENVKNPIKDLEGVILGMAKGDFELNFELDHVKEISSLTSAIHALKEFFLSKNSELENEKNRLESVDWVKTNLKDIMDSIAAQKTLEMFSRELLKQLSSNLKCQVGKLYIIDQNKADDELFLIGVYGLEKIEGDSISIGFGLDGECVLEGEIKYISNLPENFLKFKTSIGEASIKHIAMAPILADGEIIGFIELGKLSEFTPIAKELLSQISYSLGLMLKTTLGRIKIEEMANFLKAQDFTLNEHSLVSITDVHGDITYANEKFCKISGFTLDELVGQNHRLVNSGSHPKEFFKDLWETIISGQPWKGEVCNKAKDGSIYWVDATIVGYKDLQGNITQFVAIRTDITESKKNQEKLFSAVEKAKVYAEAKGNFLANMSHEIRTPMNGVLGMLALLEETKLDQEQIDMIGTLKGCGNDLLVIINDILDFSKIEAGKLILEKNPFDIKATIADIVKLLGISAGRKSVRLTSKFPSDLPQFFLGDVTRLRQVLINLVNNAIKFTENGSVTIDLTYKLEGDKYLIKFSVIDTGIGISAEHQNKLFQSFTQVDSSISRKYGGTGLGLAISYRIAEVMGGFMWLESEEGKGSTFYVEIPLEESRNQTLEVEDTTISITYEDEQLDKNLKLLIVEDNLINQKILKMLLKKSGYSCDTAQNGQVCLDMMRHNIYDLIFMDMQMPVMDGITATRKIIEIYGENRPRIVATTANVLQEDIDRCNEAGMDDFLPKPIKKQSLVEQLNESERLLATSKKAS
jgi:PAS domain S-box-containing protein